MSLESDLREALGVDDLLARLDRIEAKVDAQQAAKPFYTINEAARYLRKGRPVVEKLLAEGRLWVVEGLDSRKSVIPQAALDSLQERPAHLRSVAS